MSIKRFEDVEAWRRAREMTRMVYRITSREQFYKDYRLRDQIRDASASVMSNIAEGFDSYSRAEFARFLTIARRSVSEVQSHMYVALDQEYVEQDDFDRIYHETEVIRKIISGFIKYLRNGKVYSKKELRVS